MIQVFHLYGNLLPVRTAEEAKAILRHNAGPHYRLVAEVETDDLEVASEKTNHIDQHWMLNPEVTRMVGENVRSTSVGDIARQGKDYWFCAPVGWEKMERPW